MTWAGKTLPFITSTQGLLVYPDARPARATFAFTQALNHRWVSTDRDYGVRRAQIPPPPHRLEVALHAVHADRQAALQGEILRMLGEHRSEHGRNAKANFHFERTVRYRKDQ